jgi:multiple sugar transport system permease protein
MNGPDPRDARAAARRPGSRRILRETLTAYLFIGPSALVIGLFGIFPAFFTVFMSLFRWRLTRGSFAGAENYEKLFGGNLLPLAAVLASLGGMLIAGRLFRQTARRASLRRAGAVFLFALCLAGFAAALPLLAAQGDGAVFDSLRVTVWYALCTVPVQLAAGLLLAVVLNRRMRGKQAFRVISLVPYIAPTVATAAVFELLFSLRPDSFANQILKAAGIGPVQWLQEPSGIIPLLFGGLAPAPGAAAIPSYWAQWAQGPSLALVAIIFYSWWIFIGYYALIYLNGLNAIPRQLYEAAEVDGAGKVRCFFSITIPLLSPTTHFLSLLGVIGTFKAFTHLYVLRSPAALGTVDPISVTIFFTAFRTGNMGYASAISLVLFFIVLGLTLLQQRTTEKGVAYGD